MFSWGNRRSYDSLTSAEYDDASEKGVSRTDSRGLSMWTSVITICNVLLFLFTAFLFWRPRHFQDLAYTTNKNLLLKALNHYSPLLDHIDIPIINKRVNGSLINRDHSIYIQSPSPEVDAAWQRLGNKDPVFLTTSQVIALGKDPSMTARYPEDFGLGPEVHIASLNAMHHFHCLDTLRRDIHYDYYYPGKIKDKRHETHTNHCIYLLLQQLMCSPSTDYIVQDWVEGQQAPFPDFSIERKCMDIEAILRYQEENGIPGNEIVKLEAPEGQRRYGMSDEFLDLFEVAPEHRIPHDSHEKDLD